MIDSEDYIDNEVCHDCIYRCGFPVGAPCWKCLSEKPFNVTGKYYVKECVTNYDRIHSASLEDLAKIIQNAYFLHRILNADANKEQDGNMTVQNEIMKWLREEIEE